MPQPDYLRYKNRVVNQLYFDMGRWVRFMGTGIQQLTWQLMPLLTTNIMSWINIILDLDTSHWGGWIDP